MKRTIGTIILLIAFLNVVAIIGRISNGNPVGSPFYIIGLILMIIGGVVLVNTSKHKFQSQIRIQDIKSKTIIIPVAEDLLNKHLASISEQKRILLDLRNKGHLDGSEYNEKVQLLNQKEIDKKNEQLDSQIKTQLEPVIKQLKELQDSGVFSHEEFEVKKENLYSEHKKFLIENPYSFWEFDTLEAWQKRSIRDYYTRRKDGDTYWFKKGTNSILSFSKEEVTDLKNQGNIINYYYIILPSNFTPDTIK